MYSKEQFIRMSNLFGTKRTPFFFLLNFDLTELVLMSLDDLKDIYLKIGNIERCPDIRIGSDKYFKNNHISFGEYKEGFDKVKMELNYGNTYLLNLTFPTHIETNYSFEEIFILAQSKYKLLYKDRFVSFSPETFVKIENNRIYSYPMKGTIDASMFNSRDMLLEDNKERFEHNTIVDLIRNDLSIVSNNVEVLKYRYIDRVHTSRGDVFQTSSEICGELNSDWNEHIGDILMQLLPAGSISGAPKQMTCRIIREAEKDNRGFYTGVFGIFDGSKLDSAVNIRFIEKVADNGMLYRSGGGITSKSDVIDEYNELINKVYLPFG